MATQQAKIPAKNFRDLIRSVLKFPPSAQIAASQVIHFGVSNGRARASVAGTVVSTASVLAMRELDSFTADYHSLESYANLLPEDATLDVEMSRKDNYVMMHCGIFDLKLALTLGDVLPKPKVPEAFFTVTEETARALRWLASIAEKDESKPDMCCVYLRKKKAMAGNQKCIGIVWTSGLPDVEMPLPLQLCSVIEPGDRLAKVDGGLILASGCGVCQVPYLMQTIGFPTGVVDRLEGAKSELYGKCPASAMATVFKDSADCVARIPNVPACIILTFKDSKIRVKAQSATTSFKTVLDGDVSKDGELWLELPEAEDAIAVFGDGDVTCRKLLPKGETSLEGDEARAVFAPVRMTT